jgi:hypothetical protein
MRLGVTRMGSDTKIEKEIMRKIILFLNNYKILYSNSNCKIN